MYHLLTFDLFKTITKSNVVFFHSVEDKTLLHNSNYFDIFDYFDFDAPTHIILRIHGRFEYVQHVSKNKLFHTSIEASKISLLIKQLEKIKLQITKSLKTTDTDKLYAKNSKDTVVLGMNFKATGLVKNKVYQPFDNDIQLRFNNLTNRNFVFVDIVMNEEDANMALRRIDMDTFVATHGKPTFYTTEYEFKSALYELGNRMKKDKKLMENYTILHHQLTHLTHKEKIVIIGHFLKNANIDVSTFSKPKVKSDQLISTIVSTHIDDLQEEFKTNTIALDEMEQLVEQSEVKDDKLLKLYTRVTMYVKPIERGFEDFVTREHIDMGFN